jgi:hypothetical protein
VERYVLVSGLCGVFSLGIVEQDLSHGGGCDGQEVRMALPLWCGLVHQSQVGFVDQCGSIEGLLSVPVLPVPSRDLVKLTIDQRDQLGKRLAIPCSQLVQEAGYSLLGSATHAHRYPRGYRQKYGTGLQLATERAGGG